VVLLHHWFKDSGTGNVALKQNFEQVADDANANAVSTGIQALVDQYNNNRQANLGFTARQSITTGNKQNTLMLPFSQIFGFCRDVDKVFRSLLLTEKLLKLRLPICEI